MLNNIDAVGNVSFILVFLEGVLSFFSPCVIPLIPVYMGYLAGNGKRTDEDGTITYDRKKVMIQTMFFIVGISFAFFILGISFTALGKFFGGNRIIFTRVGGIFIILLGLFQLGVFDFRFLQKERKIHFTPADGQVKPLGAFAMGFTFSFAWTPCIGPALSSVLIMASGASTAMTGFVLVIIYALGFLIPFLALGLFTAEVLNFLKKKQKYIRYTIKAGAVILIIMGIMTFTGWMNSFSGYLNGVAPGTTSTGSDNTGENKEDLKTAADFTLKDQYGNIHRLSDYRGKVVFVNFWATWCPPCKKELPDIEKLYREYGQNSGDVIFLGITNPSSTRYPNNQDKDKNEITAFVNGNGYTFPTLFDESGEVLRNYSISAFPTTFMIDREGRIFGYVPGMMTEDIMRNVISQTLQSK